MRQPLLRKFVNFCAFAAIILLSICTLQAQSTNQSFPTAVTTNEINGKIPARDIGDARLTNYFYVFSGNQGDVFINVVTKNFDGDIDVFTLNGLRPMTKITMYSDSSDNETGRIVYLRQPEKLLLRIEGRTPNDDPATFRIKFAGSFEPIRNLAENEEQQLPEVKADEGEVRVNSVGTIIEKKPKPTPQKKEEPVKNSDDKVAEKEEKKETVADKKEDEKRRAEKEIAVKEEKKKEESEKPKKPAKTKEKTAPVVVITDNIPKTEEKKEEKAADKKEEKTDEKTTKKAEEETAKKTEEQPAKKKKETKPDPLASINLVVLFKDGTKIEHPMSDVVRVNVDKGILTIITKDGLISRYSILDVAEMTIK